MDISPNEEATVCAFIVPEKRKRYLSSLSNCKRRPNFLNCLNHCRDIDPRYATEIPTTADIAALLRNHGALDDCHVISDYREIDGREMSLIDAVNEADAIGWGTIISCIPGRLACYLDEAGSKRRLLLVRSPDR
jgi:hypothetical protein